MPDAALGPFRRGGARIEERFRRRLDALQAETRRLLQLAAADPVGEPLLVWRAAELLGIRPEAARPAAEAGLLEFGARVRFRHPLVRSAAYRSALLRERQAVHRALAQVTDPQVDPDRRAWHRAHAAPGPDEEWRRSSSARPTEHVAFAAPARQLRRASSDAGNRGHLPGTDGTPRPANAATTTRRGRPGDEPTVDHGSICTRRRAR